MDFEEISVQIIFKDVIEIACNIPGLIDTAYDGMVDIFKLIVNYDSKNKFNPNQPLLTQTLFFFAKSNKFTFLKEIIHSLKCDTLYLMKPIALNLAVIHKKPVHFSHSASLEKSRESC